MSKEQIKHTPGPWAFSTNDQWGDTRYYITQQEGAPYTPNYSDVATLVAETCSGDRVAIQLANARLIAAAPELLEALIGLDEAFCSINEFSTKDERHDARMKLIAARSAVAKATGAA